MLDDLKKDCIQRMVKCVQQFQADTKKLRTGRAHPSLVENLKVDYYGTETPLNQLANISIEDARTLLHQDRRDGASPFPGTRARFRRSRRRSTSPSSA